MKNLYVPWRHAYVTKKDRAGHPDGKTIKNGCIFCHKFESNQDEENLVVKRFNHCAVLMNFYPYSAGHIMVLPLEHKASLADLNKEARSEMMEAVSASAQVLEKVMNCQGLNIGINLGVAGGGGIPSHLHIHVIPRWLGDTNFLATVGETTLICTDFAITYQQLFTAFEEVTL